MWDQGGQRKVLGRTVKRETDTTCNKSEDAKKDNTEMMSVRTPKAWYWRREIRREDFPEWKSQNGDRTAGACTTKTRSKN